MCEFCHQHGEGHKWYLEARNYSEDLLSDLKRRRKIEEFFADPDHLARSVRYLETLDHLPERARKTIGKVVTRRQKEHHFGQVVPMEDVERIFTMVNSVVRLACFCRMTTVGPEQRYCYGLSFGPDGGRLAEIVRSIDADYLTGPETKGLEVVEKDEALAALRSYEREGMCHTVWTFETPFIGGLCNCNKTDCYAMRATVGHQVPVFFRGEYAAVADAGKCIGCGACARVCQFNALALDGEGKVRVDDAACYGCGVCRSVCPAGALELRDRAAVPGAAGRW